MKYATLGRSGLRVSRVALGCMSFADPALSSRPWTLDEDAAGVLFRRAVELGITLWDTSNSYGGGLSEEYVGRAVRKYASREEVVVATKVFHRTHPGPGGAGLSRRAILEQIDASLRRLDMDYVDLYQIHRFDPATPVEETMSALHDVVKAGKVRYIGASSMWAWQLAKMQHAAELHGWTSFVSMQNQYSLMQREDEREMYGLLADQGLASLPWSPLARGRLSRPWGEETARSSTDDAGRRWFPHDDRSIVAAVQQVAEQRGVTMARVALAWVMRHPVVTSPIVGATTAMHLDEAAAALEVKLTSDEVAILERHYTPRPPHGFTDSKNAVASGG